MADETRETFGFPIEVTLTHEEKLDNLNRIADIDRKIIDVEKDKAIALSKFGEEFKSLKKEKLTRLEQDTAGKCKVEVQCYHERDERRGIMLTMRCDNGEIVDERALTADERGAVEDERQGNLFEGGAPSIDASSEDEDEPAGDPDDDANLAEYLAQQSNGDEATDPRAH